MNDREVSQEELQILLLGLSQLACESSQLWVNQKTNLEEISTFLLENISGLIFTVLKKYQNI